MTSTTKQIVLLYLPISQTIVTWHRLQHRVFYLTGLYHGPLLHDIDCNTECSTLPAYITDHCYMASSAAPSVLPYLPISQTIVTWHRLQHRVFYLTCLYLRPLLHGIDRNTECSTLPAYITDHCYMASSPIPSVLHYLPISRTIVKWHRLQHRVFYLICLSHGPLLHGIVCSTECSTLTAYITDHCYMASSPIPSVLHYLPTSRTIVTWHRLQHRVFYLTCLHHRPLLHGIVCNTECSTLPAYITDLCYMASTATPSVLPYLPSSQTIVTWHRL